MFHVEPPILVVSNQKGGVGKTTAAVNIAMLAAVAGRRVLLVDNDPQGNASSHVGVPPGEHSVYDGALPVITSWPNLSAIAGGIACAEAERTYAHLPGSTTRLREALAAHQGSYDLIVVDNPPNLTWLPTNALRAATHLLIPVQSEYFALEGLAQLIAHVADLADRGETAIRRHLVLLTMADPAVPMSQEVASEVRKHFGRDVIPGAIPRDPAVAAAPSHGRPLAAHDPLGPGALAFLAATRHLLEVLDER